MMSIKTCKVCGGNKLHKILDLGMMPNANKLLKDNEIDNFKVFPLKYYWCSDCSFFQQIDLISSQDLFERDYTYQTGINPPAIEHFKSLVSTLLTKVDKKSLAVVLASNDGTEIEILRNGTGLRNVIGVEPAKNMAELANSKGLTTINAFFDRKVSEEIISKHGRADIVMANNVMAHIPDPFGFLSGIEHLLSDDGVAIVEVQWLKDFVDKIAIEMLYAEHYYIWSSKAMKELARRSGLVIVDIDILEKQQGGSLRFWMKKNGNSTEKLESVEKRAGLYDLKTMLKLQERSDERKNNLRNLIVQLKSDGKIIDIWSVPAKVSTMLNYSGLDSTSIRFAYDSTPAKIGKYIPKTRIPILDEKHLHKGMNDPPDFLIIGAWNYIEYARQKLNWFTKEGGRLINLLDGSIE